MVQLVSSLPYNTLRSGHYIRVRRGRQISPEEPSSAQRTTATKELQPAGACKRYLEKRLDYLDYKTALKAGLPIGSGETESAHRWVIQARLKIAGAWWKIDNAERTLKLRTMRASNELGNILAQSSSSCRLIASPSFNCTPPE